VAGVVVVVVVVAAATITVYHERSSFLDALDRIGSWAMVGSLVAAMASVVFTFLVWREVLLGLDVHLPAGVAARVFFVSQLGKYLPGSVWPVVIQMEAGRSHGAARRTMLAANLITLVLSCAVGLVIACVLLPFSDADALSRYWWLLLALPFLLALLHPRAVPLLLDRVLALIGRAPVGQRLHVRNSLRASAWSALSFVALGAHIAILGAAMGAGGFSNVVLYTGGMALAVCAGVLFIPAPAGAGIRDVLLRLVLAGSLAAGPALAVVVASRVLLIAADILLAAGAAAARHWAPADKPVAERVADEA
jgi:glycosyltransferase 2 family protein